MRFSFNTLNHSPLFGGPPRLPEQIRLAATAGYDFVGLDLASVVAHDEAGLRPKDLAEVMEEHDISCFEMVPIVLGSDREQCTSQLRLCTSVVTELKPQVVYTLSREPPSPALAANLDYVASELADMGIGCALEFVTGWGVASFAEARDLVAASGADVGLVLDTWQFLRGDNRVAELRAVPSSALAFVQMSDVGPPSPAGLDHEMSQAREMPGDGVGDDLLELCGVVFGMGFDGVVSVEMLSAPWRERPIDEFIRTTFETTRALCDRAVALNQ
jgi:sugar phosphate isomerase/epimerase